MYIDIEQPLDSVFTVFYKGTGGQLLFWTVS